MVKFHSLDVFYCEMLHKLSFMILLYEKSGVSLSWQVASCMVDIFRRVKTDLRCLHAKAHVSHLFENDMIFRSLNVKNQTQNIFQLQPQNYSAGLKRGKEKTKSTYHAFKIQLFTGTNEVAPNFSKDSEDKKRKRKYYM